MTEDDRLALLAAIHKAAGEDFAPEGIIRQAIGFHRLPGDRLASRCASSTARAS